MADPLTRMLQTARFFADLVLPDTCVLCRLPQQVPNAPSASHFDDHLCPYCRAAVALNSNPCTYCAVPLPTAQTVCGRCVSAPLVDAATVPILHQHCGAHLISRLKFHNGAREAHALCGFMLAAIKQRYCGANPLPDCLVPVPIARSTMLRRGYNQAYWLARPLQHQLDIPVVVAAHRPRRGPSQRALTRNQRLSLPANTFRLRSHAKIQRLLFQSHVAIVDDVLTTGSTVSTLAATLRRAGVRRIDVWAATRA